MRIRVGGWVRVRVWVSKGKGEVKGQDCGLGRTIRGVDLRCFWPKPESGAADDFIFGLGLSIGIG